MSLKAEIEAIIYATETPVTVEQISTLVKDTILAETAPEPDPEKVVSIDASPITANLADAPKNDAAIKARIKSRVVAVIEELTVDYASASHGIEIRSVAGGYRMATKLEYHDLMRGFAKSLKPPIRLSLAALETLAVIAYKQPVTVPEINEVRGVDAGGVITTLLDRKLITTAGRKQVIGRPILYKTTKEFLMRFGLNEVGELPSMEEFEKLVSESFQNEMFETEHSAAGTSSNTAETASGEAPEEARHQASESEHDTTTEAMKS
jgi:segregation and condensation protein B